MLQAMNTGHDGSLSTGHANSPEGMLSRLETMVLTGSAELPLEAIRQQIASAVDYIVHLSRLRDFSRKCMEITEVTGYKYDKGTAHAGVSVFLCDDRCRAVYLLSVYSGCGDRWIYNRDLAGEELFPDCDKETPGKTETSI